MLFSTRKKFWLFLKSCILLYVANLLLIISEVTRLSAESILKRMCKQRKNEFKAEKFCSLLNYYFVTVQIVFHWLFYRSSKKEKSKAMEETRAQFFEIIHQ